MHVLFSAVDRIQTRFAGAPVSYFI